MKLFWVPWTICSKHLGYVGGIIPLYYTYPSLIKFVLDISFGPVVRFNDESVWKKIFVHLMQEHTKSCNGRSYTKWKVFLDNPIIKEIVNIQPKHSSQSCSISIHINSILKIWGLKLWFCFSYLDSVTMDGASNILSG